MKQAKWNTLLSKRLRALSRAIRRVPPGPELERTWWSGRVWDPNTRLYLPRR